MRKVEQLAINEQIKGYLELLKAEIGTSQLVGKLRTCNVKVYEKSHFTF